MSEFSLHARQNDGNTPTLSEWGADSDYGVLRDVLLGPVDNYQWLKTSSVSKKSIRRGYEFDNAVARAQHAEMVDAYQSAGVNVHFLEADPNLPYQVFARDSSVMTPYGAFITNMSQWWRRGEYGPVLDFCFENNLPVYDKVTAGAYEGGDFMLVKPGHLLLGYSGERSQEQSALQIKRWFEQEGWDVCLYEFDPYFVHADCTIGMLTDNLAAACTDVVTPEVQAWLAGLGIEILEVPFTYVSNLGINVVSLGDDRVLMPKQSDFLADRCRGLGLTVYDPDVSAITMVGGGIHCMCQPLKRD